MRVFKAVALLGCAFLASVAMGAASIPEEQDVLVLDDDNFDAAIEAHPLLLVEFYAPWCGHCKKLEPEYAKAAGELKKQDPRIYIAKIDASAHKTAGEKHNIRGFPTLKLFKSGSVLDYNGGRSADDIVEFMIKKSGPPATTLKSKDDAKAFLEKHAAGAGIAFFKSLTDEAATKFLDFAGKNDAFPLAITDDAGVLSEYKAKAGTLQFVTKEGAATKALEGAEDKDLAAFMFAHSVAVFQEYSAATNRALFGGPISVHVLSIFDKAGKDFDKLATEVKKVGEKRRTDALFIHMPTSEDKILGAFDMKAEDAPKVVIADLRSGALKKYFLEEPITAKNVESFLDKFLKGELKAKLKTEAVAPEDTTGPVTVLKGASFNDLVIANDKDVLVEFYAPWCGHCKSLAPKYDELGAKFKGVKTVTIAKMDSTANEIEVPGVDIRGFPTILFFPGNKKDSPVPYEGAREVADFTKFIKKNAATPFALDDEDEDEDADEDADEANDEL